MKLNEFNNAFQTEQQCLAYIANLKENKCIRCFNFNGFSSFMYYFNFIT
ncbi:hypothetical protein [Spiroplasma endosymbiont of Apeira syringaria]